MSLLFVRTKGLGLPTTQTNNSSRQRRYMRSTYTTTKAQASLLSLCDEKCPSFRYSNILMLSQFKNF